MTRYSWPVGSQNEASIAGGRLAEQLRARVGLSGWALDASVYAGLSEVLATTSDVYNVRSFGAVGDGAADDTDALQATIDAALSDQSSFTFPEQYAIVVVPRGRYRHTGLVVPAGACVHIIAYGAQFEVEGAVVGLDVQGTSSERCGLIMHGGSWIGDDTAGSVGHRAVKVTTVHSLRDVSFSHFETGVELQDTQDASWYDVHIESCTDYGIYFNGDAGAAGIFNCQFSHLFVRLCDVGLYFKGECADLKLWSADIRANGTHEIKIESTTRRNSAIKFYAGHFERAFSAPQASVAVWIDMADGGLRGSRHEFCGCVWSGTYTTCAQVGQVIGCMFRDCTSFSAVTNTVLTDDALGVGVVVDNWTSIDNGIPLLTTGQHNGLRTPSALGEGDTDDYNADNSGIQTKTLRVGAHASGSTLTGIVNGWQGRELRIINTSANNLTIGHENTGSEADNRFRSPSGSDVVLAQWDAITVLYDDISGTRRWQIVGLVQ